MEENITSYFFIRPGDNEWSAYTIQKFTSKQNQSTTRTHTQWTTAIESHMHWQGSTVKFCGCNSYSCIRQSVETTNALALNQTRIQSEHREHWTDIGNGDEKELNSFWVFCMRRSYVHANCQFTSPRFAVFAVYCLLLPNVWLYVELLLPVSEENRKIRNCIFALWVRCSRKWNRIFCQCFALIRAPTSHTATLIPTCGAFEWKIEATHMGWRIASCETVKCFALIFVVAHNTQCLSGSEKYFPKLVNL